MTYRVKFPGTRGNPEQFLVENDKKLSIGSEEAAAKFKDNALAVDAALEITRQMAMFGLVTRPFAIEFVKEETPAKS